jgi:hypothetical protein
MAAIVAVFLLAITPIDDTVRESVDLVELNHFYDEHGRLVFDQLIFYDWSAAEERYHVRTWRLVKHPGQIPERDWRCGCWRCCWQDGEQRRLVIAAAQRETWTQYDPELVEREYLPKERRRELRTITVQRPCSGNGIKGPTLTPDSGAAQ